MSVKTRVELNKNVCWGPCTLSLRNAVITKAIAVQFINGLAKKSSIAA